MDDDQHAADAALPAVVVALPAEIDLANASEVGRELTDALSSAAVVITDMTRTTFADSLGLRALVQAQKHAAAKGAEFRVVLSSPHVLRVLSITRLDSYLSIYRTLDQALASDTDAGEPLPGGNTDPTAWASPPVGCRSRIHRTSAAHPGGAEEGSSAPPCRLPVCNSRRRPTALTNANATTD
jgi:anti-sigma B factor antagonist